jgi:hypothetical protein
MMLFLQRRLHSEVQNIFLLLTRRVDLTIALFSILFFPGVLLHESSHYLMAKLLRVRTGRVSLLPRALGGGKLQMGFVEVAASDPLRETLIGAAPLIAGGLFTAFAGLVRLGLLELWNRYALGGLPAASAALPALAERPDFWLWLYLTFVISSTMFPSAADRHAWLPVMAVIGSAAAIGMLAGAGPWLAANVAPLLERALLAVAIVFIISLALHAVFIVPLWVIRRLLSAMLHLEVVSHP